MKQHAEGLLWLASFSCMFAAALTPPGPYVLFLAILWAITTTTVVPLHFLKAWRKLGAAPNKRGYALWVAFEILCTVGLASGMAWLCVSDQQAHGVAKSRERTLRSNLQVIRSVLNQYSIDHHKRPQSLDELVATGYLRMIPNDPITRRNDSWTLEWSNDPKNPGIVNVHSGSRSISSERTEYRDW